MDFYQHLSSDQVITLGVFWNVLPLLAGALINIAFSAAVFSDAMRLQKQGYSLVLANGWIWSLAVLVGGVFVAIGYWLVHHSSLVR